jgi:hypothetical protein
MMEQNDELADKISETLRKIDGLIRSDQLDSVEQGVVLLDSLFESNLFANVTQELWGVYSEHQIFEDIYDPMMNFGLKHPASIISFLCEHAKNNGVLWAQNIDAYLQQPWEKMNVWPERKPLGKHYIYTMPDTVPESFLDDVVRVRQMHDNSISLITADYQIVEISTNVLDELCEMYPTHKVFVDYQVGRIALLNETSVVAYQSSLLHQHLAKNTTTSELLEKLLSINSYRWVRETAAANPVLDSETLISMIENADRYILKGILKNPNTPIEQQESIRISLQDTQKYPIETNEIIFSSKRAIFGDSAYMGLEELVQYCLKIKGDNCSFIESLELPEGIQIQESNWHTKNFEQAYWEGCEINFGDVSLCIEEESTIEGSEGRLLLESHMNSDFDAWQGERKEEGSVYIALQLEYPFDMDKMKLYTNERGIWAVDYDGETISLEQGSPDCEGGYYTSLKIYTEKEWEELPSIMGANWSYDFLIKDCNIDPTSENATTEMKEWLLENHPILKNAIASIHKEQ